MTQWSSLIANQAKRGLKLHHENTELRASKNRRVKEGSLPEDENLCHHYCQWTVQVQNLLRIVWRCKQPLDDARKKNPGENESEERSRSSILMNSGRSGVAGGELVRAGISFRATFAMIHKWRLTLYFYRFWSAGRQPPHIRVHLFWSLSSAASLRGWMHWWKSSLAKLI